MLEQFRGKNIVELGELFSLQQQQSDREDEQNQHLQSFFPRKNLVSRMKEVMKEHEEVAYFFPYGNDL